MKIHANDISGAVVLTPNPVPQKHWTIHDTSVDDLALISAPNPDRLPMKWDNTLHKLIREPLDLETARKRKLAALATSLRTDLLAIFASWTVGEQYDFDGARVALNADLEAGNLARAITGVTQFRAGDTSIEDHRAAVLAVLTVAAAKFTALAAATTIEAINAIS